MPFDAGIIDASPDRTIISLSFIDANGQVRTDSYDVPVATTDAELNAFAQAIGAASNSSLWAVQKSTVFAPTPPSLANAVDDVHVSVKDNIVLLYKNNANLAVDVFIPAPVLDELVPSTTNPDPLNELIIAVVAASDAVWDAFAIVSYRFTERKKKNRAVKA